MNYSGPMDDLDQLNIETPEQVDLRLPIVLLFFAVFLSPSELTRFGEVADTTGKWIVASLVLFQFLLFWGYFGLFEAFWNGQTPGKRLVKIRVIKDSGRQITLFEALARNLIRVVDLLPNFYLVGLVSMLRNRQQKRLGDFVAGTIVIHERSREQPLSGHNSRSITASVYQPPAPEYVPRTGRFQPPADAIARLRAQDLNVIESFLARALDFDSSTRTEIAGRIATSVFTKMNVPLPPEQNAERALEAISHAMRSQGANESCETHRPRRVV